MVRSSLPANGARRWLVILLIALVVIGLLIAAGSAYRMMRRRGPPPPRQTDVSLIAGWMTVPYVSRTFRVPPGEIERSLGVPPHEAERRGINDLAAVSGRTPEQALAIVRATVADFQATHPPPKPGPFERGPPPERPPGAAP